MTRWCETDEVWFDDDFCYVCDDPGIPARAAHASARSWRNPATWTSGVDDHDWAREEATYREGMGE